MRTHQQGKAGTGKLRTTIFSIIVVLIMLFGASITLATTVPAKADTGGYPYASIACVWPPYAITGKGNWCKKVVGGKIVSDYDWGTIHNDNSSKSEQSPYGYDYRNCTDYVAWEVASLGVLPAQYKGLGNAKDWPTKAPGKGLTVDTTPAIGAAAVKTTGTFGHVAFISAYNSSTGVMTVQEYNHFQDGNYGTRSGTLSNLGFSQVVHFEKYEKGGSGTLDWRYQTGDASISSPAVVNGVVYVGSNDSYVYALKASSGTLLWRYQTGTFVISSPAVVNGTVYVGSEDSYVYALKASSGTLLWRYQTGNAVRTKPAVVNGVVYIGTDDFNIYALNASGGTLLWRYQTGNFVSSPAVVNGTVYVGSEDSYVYALNASGGTLLWRYQTGNGVYSTPTMVNGVVYVSSADDSAYALTT
jgi:outer membrane protein assembly factor BamB